MIITSYSHTKHHLRLGELMHGNKHLLPPHLGESKFVLAYRAAPKLAKQLVTYRFPQTERAPDMILPPSPRM